MITEQLRGIKRLIFQRERSLPAIYAACAALWSPRPCKPGKSARIHVDLLLEYANEPYAKGNRACGTNLIDVSVHSRRNTCFF